MPTYEYKCKQCDHKFEVFQRMSASPLDACEKCGGPVKRLLGAGAGIIFKGAGFYCTDYRKTGSSPTASAEGGDKASTASAPPAKSSSAEAGGKATKAEPVTKV